MSEERDESKPRRTAVILEVGLAWASSLGQGANIGLNDNRGAVVVNATVASCRFLTRRREMGMLAASALWGR